MTSTLGSFLRAAHPHQLIEPLDATTPTDLPLLGPTVLIEVDGAREGLDALARVRRVVVDAPVAAVRIGPVVDGPSGRRRAEVLAALAGVVAGLVAVALAALGAIRVADDAPGGGAATALLLASAPVLAFVAVRSWLRVRRLPVERRRYRERHRSSAVIAVPVRDESAAASLVGRLRRVLADAGVAGLPCEVSVHRPGDALPTDAPSPPAPPAPPQPPP